MFPLRNPCLDDAPNLAQNLPPSRQKNNINKQTKTVQPKSKDEPGKQLSSESPLHASNVMHYSKEKGVRSRVGHKTVDGKKVRVLKKTGEVLVDRPNTKKAAAAAAEPAAE